MLRFAQRWRSTSPTRDYSVPLAKQSLGAQHRLKSRHEKIKRGITMTGLRAARISAGYTTAREAHAAFAKGKKGREGLSLSYWQKLEAGGPRLQTPILTKRLAQFLGCSANQVFAWKGEATTNKTTNTMKGIKTASLASISSRSPGRGRAVATGQPGAKT
jgi:hypothetical protein